MTDEERSDLLWAIECAIDDALDGDDNFPRRAAHDVLEAIEKLAYVDRADPEHTVAKICLDRPSEWSERDRFKIVDWLRQKASDLEDNASNLADDFVMRYIAPDG